MEDIRRPEVFARFYEENYRDLYRFALYTLKNPQDAEDVVSETVADAYATVEKLRDQTAFRGWIFTILSNKCRKKLKEYTEKPVELPENLTAHSKIEEAVQVREAFGKLEEEDRLLISMKVFGGYKSHEIGTLLNMNGNTVRSRISRGLCRLRGLLQ